MTDETKTPETENETAETPEAEVAENESAEAEAKSLFARLKADFFEAGQTGRKQWEEIFTRSREAVTKTHERVRSQVNSSLDTAQGRGADLLLKLLAQLRKGADSLEASIKKAAPAENAEGEPVAETA